LKTIEEITAAAPRNRYYQYLRIQHMELLAESYYSIEDMSAGDPRKAAVNRKIRDLAKEFLASDPADSGARINMASVESASVLALVEINPQQAVEYAQSALAEWDAADSLLLDEQTYIPGLFSAGFVLLCAALHAQSGNLNILGGRRGRRGGHTAPHELCRHMAFAVRSYCVQQLHISAAGI
jgi:hypothetical protein